MQNPFKKPRSKFYDGECGTAFAGNFLNAGNRNLAATGFQIETLVKLKDVRSTRARYAHRSRSMYDPCTRRVNARDGNAASPKSVAAHAVCNAVTVCEEWDLGANA